MAGSLAYLVGNILTTMTLNVPLNNLLAEVDPESARGAEIWDRYLVEWTRGNTLRAVTGIAAAGLLIGGLIA